MTVISYNNPSVVGEPAERSLDCISSTVAIPESVVLSIDVAMVLSTRNKKIDSPLPQTFAGWIAVVRFVSDYSLRPGPRSSGSSSWDLDLSITLSRRVISAGEVPRLAGSVWLPRGTPLPSTNTKHFDPFPRLVFPTPAPFFCRKEARIHEDFIPIKDAVVVQL